MKMKPRFLSVSLVVFLLLVAAVSRIVNAELHLWNFAPVAALGLFSGAVLKDKRYAYLLPLGAQLLADLYFQLFTDIPGFYGVSQLFVYAGMALVAAFGTTMGRPTVAKVSGYALAGSGIFFLVSNLGAYFTGMWGWGVSGLVKTFVMAVPFYQGTLIGDLVFAALFFGVYALVQQSRETRVATA
ncbi:MAG: hypothetical protein EOP52_02665 [Sphingobacteriales bacterium]|nr:MAG: hypothetical protein EOP52_02665 [Sphingobacteriales bacterium]